MICQHNGKWVLTENDKVCRLAHKHEIPTGEVENLDEHRHKLIQKYLFQIEKTERMWLQLHPIKAPSPEIITKVEVKEIYLQCPCIFDRFWRWLCRLVES